MYFCGARQGKQMALLCFRSILTYFPHIVLKVLVQVSDYILGFQSKIILSILDFTDYCQQQFALCLNQYYKWVELLFTLSDTDDM